MALVAVALAWLASGCFATGAYPVDYFPEMHYAPAPRRQEPPRLAPPTASVPVTGRERPLTLAEAAALPNPLPRTPDRLAQAQNLYRVNCAICHGPDGRGDGHLAPYFQAAGQTPPQDYTSANVTSLTDGQLYWVLTYGQGGMPPFGNLLTPDERWALVQFVRQLQGR